MTEATRPHQWVVIVTYGLTDAEANATDAGVDQRLDAEHRLSIDGPACMNCERLYSSELAARPCSAPQYRVEPDANTRVRQR